MTFKNITHAFAVAGVLCTSSAALAGPTNICLALLGDTSSSVGGSGAAPMLRWGPGPYRFGPQPNPRRSPWKAPKGKQHKINFQEISIENTPVKDLKDDPLQEYARMVSGMAAAFRHPDVIQKIIENGPVAVNYTEFSDDVYPRLNWRVLGNGDDARAFANDLDNLARFTAGGTQTQKALFAAMEQLKQCPARDESTHDVIDLATDDSPTNSSFVPETEIDDALGQTRNVAEAKGITIHALAMLTAASGHGIKYGYQGLVDYLKKNAVTRPTGKVFEVANSNNYEEAFVRKFSYEMTYNPPLWHRYAVNTAQP